MFSVNWRKFVNRRPRPSGPRRRAQRSPRPPVAWVEPLEQRQLMSAYVIDIKTSNKDSAGTDANVYITLQGTRGEAPAIQLPNSPALFEKGRPDRFRVDTADVGTVTGIKIWHDNAGNKPGWHLEKVTVAGRQFAVNKWLAMDSADLNYSTGARVVPGSVTPLALDFAGNSFESARHLGRLADGATLERFDWVNGGDTDDFYRFEVGYPDESPTSFRVRGLTVSLTGLRADADLYLYDSAGNLVASSLRGGTADDTIRIDSRAVGGSYFGVRAVVGTYFLKVHRYEGDTPYKLSVGVDDPGEIETRVFIN